MSIEVISVPLSKPPLNAGELSSKDNLLVVWQRDGYVIDEYGMEYHFAIHSPTWGWRGYRWNEKCREPWKMLPATQNTVWVHVHPCQLMHLQIRQNGEVAIANVGVEVRELLYADEMGSLVKIGDSKIECLRFSKDNNQASRSDILCDDIYSCWAHFLSDGTIAICDYCRLRVISPEGILLHEEAGTNCRNHPPFIIRHDDTHFYYTDDPRNEWGKNDALEAIRKRIGLYAEVKFFTTIGNEHYIAFDDRLGKIHLYCLFPQSPARVEYVWTIAAGLSCGFARHDRFICMTYPPRIYGDTSIPKNNGFLAWDPITNTFHTDIPRTTSIQRISTGRIKTINIPNIWGKNALQR